MPIVKLFNGEEVTGDILEDRDTELVIENFSDTSKNKKVIKKQEIFSIDF